MLCTASLAQVTTTAGIFPTSSSGTGHVCMYACIHDLLAVTVTASSTVMMGGVHFVVINVAAAVAISVVLVLVLLLSLVLVVVGLVLLRNWKKGLGR